MLLSVEESKKKENHYKGEKTIKVKDLRRERITINIVFKYLKINVALKSREFPKQEVREKKLLA